MKLLHTLVLILSQKPALNVYLETTHTEPTKAYSISKKTNMRITKRQLRRIIREEANRVNQTHRMQRTRRLLESGAIQDIEAEIEAARDAAADSDDGGYANMIGTQLIAANLHGMDLSYVDFTGADLSGADLSGADLESTIFTNANLSNANLAGANLKDTDMTGANLTGVDFTEAFIRRANFKGAYGHGTIDTDGYPVKDWNLM